MPDFPELTADLIRRLRDPEQSLTRSDIYWITNTAADRLSALQERNAELERKIVELMRHRLDAIDAALSQEPTRQGEG